MQLDKKPKSTENRDITDVIKITKYMELSAEFRTVTDTVPTSTVSSFHQTGLFIIALHPTPSLVSHKNTEGFISVCLLAIASSGFLFYLNEIIICYLWVFYLIFFLSYQHFLMYLATMVVEIHK